jgi:glutamine phosphoribosylpyrophosphate amidotransferase
MCSVIGAIIKEPRAEDLLMLHRVFLESKIRGMHATGLSYVKNGQIVTIKHPVPADEFPFNFAEYINEDGNLYIVGHCRYSTSDLEYNQPISNDNLQ